MTNSILYISVIGYLCTFGHCVTTDLSCLHSTSWLLNQNDNYNAIYKTVTDVQSSAYTSGQSGRRLQSGPPSPPSESQLTGWQAKFSTIPSYGRVFTSTEITTLNSRPKAATDFDSGVTSVSAGQYVEFGEDIGFNSNSCGDGYWPPGPGCPAKGNGTKTFNIFPSPEGATGGCYVGGSLGYLVNGVALWSWSDASSYNDAGIWHQLALKFEANDMDLCTGHAARDTYHHHSVSTCLMAKLGDDGTAHSPVHGFANDGFPIYGPYQDAGNTLAVSCWKTRDYSSATTGCTGGKRTCQLKDESDYTLGTSTVTSGPSLTGTITGHSSIPVSAVSGAYYEDYYYDSTCSAAGSQYLDAHNGHSHGTLGYHYHMTMTATNMPVFPYSVGPKYYGCLQFSGCATSRDSSVMPSKPSVCTNTNTVTTPTCTSFVSSPAVSSAKPSSSPSTVPTKSPTTVPSTAVTISPTVEQTAPTYSPTLTPTSPPSTIPSATPSNVPSATPSRGPSVAPTLTPSAQTGPVIAFNASLTLTGLSSSVLDTKSKGAVVIATAASLNVTADCVSFVGSTFTEDRRRRSLVSVGHVRQHHHEKASTLSTYTVVVVTHVKVSLVNYGLGADETAVYNALENNLQSAVSNGAFVAKLVAASLANGATATSSVTSASATVSEVTVVAPPTALPSQAPKEKETETLSTGAIVGIAVGGAVFVCLMLLAACHFISGGSVAGTARVSPSGSSVAVATVSAQKNV